MFWIFLALLFSAGTAMAQMYKWIDKDGKVRYGDTPPAGSKTTSIKAPKAGDAPAPGPSTASVSAPRSGDTPPTAKDAKKGPLTPAEQEQEYRKRQQESAQASKKAEQESQAQAAKSEGCERTKEYLRTLQSGQRIARTNPSGERYYMDDAQVAQEIAKAQQSVQQSCK